MKVMGKRMQKNHQDIMVDMNKEKTLEKDGAKRTTMS